MLAGDPYRTSYNASNPADKAVSYNCLNYNGGAPPEQGTFFTQNCPNGLRKQIHFPSCWDGVNLDSSDHKSHMSYPIGSPEGGDCPSSHPVKIVNLFYEFTSDVGRFDFVQGHNNWGELTMS
jgi:hypothetical protein